MRYSGIVLMESLDSIACIDMLRITKREVWHPENTADFQPKTWNAVTFENDDDSVTLVVETLSKSLKEKWFIDISAVDKKYVVFKNTIFAYGPGESAQRAKAVAYGRAVGIPESQLDWAD